MNRSDFGTGVKQYFRYFRVLFIIVAVFAIAWTCVYFFQPEEEGISFYESPNESRVYGDRRVFDYGDQLSDSEEEELEAYIYEAELKTCCDIVIVTLDESLRDFAPEYRANYTMSITPDKYVMVYADKFWEDNKFGYDSPQVLDGTTATGDGVILVDNLHFEEETNLIYTWMGTTGIVEDTYSSDMIDSALDVFYSCVDDDYLEACELFVDRFVSDMTGEGFQIRLVRSGVGMIILSLLVAAFYCLINAESKSGKVTTTPNSYLISGSVFFPEMEDRFLRKSVTKVYNPPTSSSSGGGGGGGHHSSGGGGSHGGGGHSR